MSNIEDIIQQYEHCKTEQDKAALEHEMSRLLEVSDAERSGLRSISTILNTNYEQARMRRMLFKMGDSAQPYWEMLNQGARMHGIRKLLEKKGSKPRQIGEKTRISNVKPKRGTPPKSELKSVKRTRTLFARVRKLIQTEVERRVEGISPIEKEKILNSFGIGIGLVFDDVQNQIRKSRKAPDVSAILQRSKKSDILAACSILNIDPPKTALLPVNLDEAYTARGRLARLYHPDLHPGDSSFIERYQEILKAYETLKTHNESLT